MLIEFNCILQRRGCCTGLLFLIRSSLLFRFWYEVLVCLDLLTLALVDDFNLCEDAIVVLRGSDLTTMICTIG